MTLTKANGLPVEHHWTRLDAMLALAEVYAMAELETAETARRKADLAGCACGLAGQHSASCDPDTGGQELT